MSGEIIAVALGLLVGLSLGALGGGGSTLAVPVLVFIAGLNAQDATTASLLVVGVASAFGVAGHFRHGNVRLGPGIAFGAAGIVGSRFGLLINRSLDENVLLLAFAALIAFVALRMYRRAEPPADATAETSDELHLDAEPHQPSGVAVKERTTPHVGASLSAPALGKLALAASAVGLLTGLFGVGGGFAVVPALTLLLKFPTRQAIGTSLVVIVINAAMALGMRAGDIGIDWAVVGPFLATVTLGVVVGTRLGNNTDADRLTRSFAVMLGVVAIYTATSTVFGA